MRSPLAYPLTRAADTDAGGAADLQTDIMRFMAILALCLVAIFALVQSLPMAPVAEPDVSLKEETGVAVAAQPAAVPAGPPAESPADAEQPIVLTRRPDPVAAEPAVAPVPVMPPTPDVQPSAPGTEAAVFTLAFESDLALTRLVASGRVGLYAIDGARASRMAISNSRVSFWEASTPNEYFEMEPGTVPKPVVDALRDSGADAKGVAWGVTLPGAMRRELENLLDGTSGGDLRIRADGRIVLEASR